MRYLLVLVVCAFGFSGHLIAAEGPALKKTTSFTFADVDTGQKILTADDNYMNRMSPAEIAIRMGSSTPDKTASDLKSLYRDNVLTWTEEEKNQIKALIASYQAKLDTLSPFMPGEVTFIKVNDKVEGGLPHTRANAIVLPVSEKGLSDTLFFHELFHVLSRQQKEKHPGLYSLIGFKACDFSGNAETNANSLTNPDVPAEGYYLPVEIEGKESAVMTFLHATKEAFDPAIKGGFGGHFGFGLLKVTVNNNQCTVDTDENGKAQILKPDSVPGFFAAIGLNTGYIIHAEEVLADNFVFLMTEKENLPNPEILERLKNWLAE